MEEEFIRDREQMKLLEEKQEEERSKVDDWGDPNVGRNVGRDHCIYVCGLRMLCQYPFLGGQGSAGTRLHGPASTTRYMLS